MLEKHQVTVSEAGEAIADPDALWFDPDPRSNSGISVRVIGYSHTRQEVLAVILVHNDEHDGYYGATAHAANNREIRAYNEALNDDEDGAD